MPPCYNNSMDLITTHVQADFDGLASMVAARKLYPGATLVLPGGAQDHVRNFLTLHDLGLTRLKDIDCSQIQRLIVVDCQDPERLGPLHERCRASGVRVHIYDHHPDPSEMEVHEVFPGLEHRVVEPVGACTSVLIEQLRKAELSLNAFEATVLALGIYEETGSLAYVSTTARDLDAAAFLLRNGADLTVVSDTLRNPLDPNLITLLNDLLQHCHTFYVEGKKVLLATSTYDRYRGDLAEAVHRLADLEGYDAVLAAFAMDNKVQLIARSRRPELDVGRIARTFGGGGHDVAAAASIKGRTLVEVKEQLIKLLTEWYRPTLLARDVMTTPAKTIALEATIGEAETTLTKYEINVVPVVDDTERYCGLITRETVQKALYHKLGSLPVEAFMQSDAYTASPETPFQEIEGRMLERNQRFVPILRDGRTIGVITRTDLLRTLHDDVLAAARARAKGAPLPRYPFRRDIRARVNERVPKHLLSRLKAVGDTAEEQGVSAYLVGGMVRDLLLGRPNLDVDVVVEGDGIAFARAFGYKLGATVKVHERFGTAILVFPDGFKLDLATARTEYYEYPTALPTVERSSIKKDLYRRDFTINTLAIRLNTRAFGELIDYYGGQRDLNEKTIRVLHSLSFVEDPTRAFRAVRFEHRFGFRLGKETLALIKGAVKMELFHRLSGARLCQELILLFSEDKPRHAAARLADLDLLQFIHPSLRWGPHLQTLLQGVEEVLDWYRLSFLDREMEGWLVYLMALLDMLSASAVKETLDRIQLPERHADKVRKSKGGLDSVLRTLARDPAPLPSETYRTLTELSDESLLLLMAKARSESVKRQVSAYLTTYQHIRPALTGEDLKGMGLKPGPQYRRILERLRDARLDDEVRSVEDERTLVHRLVAEPG